MGASTSSLPDPLDDPDKIHQELVRRYSDFKGFQKLVDNLTEIRYLCRLRGLPKEFDIPLFDKLNKSSPRDKVILAQIIKYANQHNPTFSKLEKLLELLKSLKNPDESNDETELQLQTELCLILCRKFDKANVDPGFLQCLQHLVKQSSSKLSQNARSEFSEFLEQYRTPGCEYEGVTTEAKRSSLLQDKIGERKEHQIFDKFATPGGLKKISTPTNQVKAHAVKVQQQTTSRTQESSSEETSLTQLNLANALNARAKTIQHSFQREVLPSIEESKSGSDTYFYRTTYYEVENLRDLAKGGKTISNDDQTYLYNKIEGAHVTLSYRSTVLLLLSEALYHISQRQRIKKDHFRVFLKSMGKDQESEYNLYVLKTVQRCVVRDSSYFSTETQNCLKAHLRLDKCTKAQKDLIFEIFSQMSNSSEAAKEIFQIAMDKLKDSCVGEKEMESALKYVSLQSLSENQVEALFDSEVVEAIGKICITEDYYHEDIDLDKRSQFLEILENYVDHNSTPGLPFDFLAELLDYEKGQDDGGFQLTVVRLVIKSLANFKLDDDYDQDEYKEILGEMALIKFCDQTAKVMTVSYLHDASENQYINHVQTLAPLLLEEDKAVLPENNYGDGNEEELPNGDFLSAIVASTILNCWKIEADTTQEELEAEDNQDEIEVEDSQDEVDGDENLDEIEAEENQDEIDEKNNHDEIATVLPTLLKSLETGRDVQTRIRCSKLLHCLAVERYLQVNELKSLDSLTADSVGDVRLHCKCAVTLGSAKLAKASESPIDSELLAMVVSHFSLDQQLLDGVDFAGQINHGVMCIVKLEANKPNTEFEKEIWDLIKLLSLPGNEKYIKDALEILEDYSKLGKNRVIPSNVLDRIELYLDGKNGNPSSETIFCNVIANGEPTSEKVLGHFCSKMVSLSGSEHKILYSLLMKGNDNQDLPSKVFSMLWLDTCFLRLNDNPRDKKIWTEVETLLGNGAPCSSLGFTTFSEFHCKRNLESYLSCLTSISEYGNSLPKDVMRNVSTICCSSVLTFREQLPKIARLCSSLLRNNQELPDDAGDLLVKEFEEGRNADKTGWNEVLAFILLLVERKYPVSDKTVDKLVKNFDKFIKTDRQEETSSLLAALVSSVKFNGGKTSLLPSFFKVFTLPQNQQHLVSLAIEGISHILRNSSEKIYLEDNQLNQLIESLHYLDPLGEAFQDVNLFLQGDTPLGKEQRQTLALANLLAIQDQFTFIHELWSKVKSDEGFTSVFENRTIFRLLNSSSRMTLEEAEKILEIIFIWIDTVVDDLSPENLSLMEDTVTRIVRVFADFSYFPKIQELTRKILVRNFFIEKNPNYFGEKSIQMLEQTYPASKFVLSHLNHKISDRTKFLIRLEHLSEAGEAEVKQILEEIKQKLICGFKADDDTIQFLIQKSDQFPEIRDLFCKVLASLLIQGEVHHDLEIKAGECLLDGIQEESQLTWEVLQVFSRILKSTKDTNKLDKMADLLLDKFRHSINYHERQGILNCLSILAQRQNLPEAGWGVLKANLYSDDSTIRRMAFKSLSSKYCQTPSDLQTFSQITSKKMLESGKLIHGGEAFDIFGKCCEGNLKPAEMSIFITLSSVNNFDHGVFSSQPSQWVKELILLDLVWGIVDPENNPQKIIMLETLDKLGNKLGWEKESTHDALFWLRDEAKSNYLTDAEFLNVVEQLLILDPKVIDTYYGMRYMHWKPKMEEAVIQMQLDEKCGIFENSHHLTSRLISKLGYNFTLQLLNKITGKIGDPRVLEKLSELLTENSANLSKLRVGQWGNCESEVELLKTAERETLILFFRGRVSLSRQDLNRGCGYIVKLHKDGAPFDKLMRLLKIRERFDAREGEALLQVLRLLVDYDSCAKLNVEQLLSQTPWKDWVTELNRQIISTSFRPGSSLKSSEEVLSELVTCDGQPQLQDLAEFSDTIKKIQSGEFTSKCCPSISLQIVDWEREEIKGWATEVKSRFAQGTQLTDDKFCLEAVAVCKRAFHLHSNFHLTNVQILSIYCGVNKGLKGALLQIATGSGKSTIVAILAVINALRQLTIDVYTSSPVLAERDAKSWSEFFSVFGLSCSHNGDTGLYITGFKACYEADIVYGEISQFQFDILRHSYSNLGTMGQRTTQFAIVDEVDSLLVDDMSKLARLSSPLPGADLLQIIYHLVWHRMLTIEKKLFTVGTNIYYVEGYIISGEGGIPKLLFTDASTGNTMEVEDLVGYIQNGRELGKAGIHIVRDIDSFIKDHLHNYVEEVVGFQKKKEKDHGSKKIPPVVKVPQHLRRFVSSQIPKWVDNCILAFNYMENVHYVVEDGQILPVDYLTTGIVQGSTSWSDGLHQFLQLKHDLRLTSETCTTNFLSNMSLFRRYIQSHDAGQGVEFRGSNIVGLTGTLGSTTTREILSSLYNCKCQNIPLTHYQRYAQYPDIMVPTKEMWLGEIVTSVKSQIARKRGALLICETIHDAKKIHDAVRKYCPMNNGIRLYTRNNSDQERQIEKILPGQVFIATNLAGRGTDINTREIEPYGGLHVCLTFLPNNVRVEEQAFGRTSRQGNYGSGQLISTLPLTNLGQSATEMRELRDVADDHRLTSFLEESLPLVEAKDECFTRFCKLLLQIRMIFRRERESLLGAVGRVGATLLLGKDADELEEDLDFLQHPQQLSVLSVLELNLLQAVEERWALFLRQMEDGSIPPTSGIDYYTFFELLVKRDFCMRAGSDHCKVIKSPYYHIAIGNDYMLKDGKAHSYISEAKRHYVTAARLDLDFCSGALLGLGNALLKGTIGLILSDRHESNYKSKAIKYYKDALTQIQTEISDLSTAQILLRNRHADENSGLEQQLTTKMNILGSISNSVDAAMSQTKRSLRPIHILGKSAKGENQFFNHFSANFADSTKETCKENLHQFSKEIEEFTLKFEGLTLSQDSGAVDQAVNTIQATHQLWSRVQLECGPLGWDKLLELTCEDILVHDLTTNEAILTLQGWDERRSYAVTRFFIGDNVRVDLLEILKTGVKKVKEKITVPDAIEFLESIPTDNQSRFWNLVCRQGNEENYKIFKKQEMDLEIQDLSISEVLELLPNMTSELSSISVCSEVAEKLEFTLPDGVAATTLDFLDNGNRISYLCGINKPPDTTTLIRRETVFTFDTKTKLARRIEQAEWIINKISKMEETVKQASPAKVTPCYSTLKLHDILTNQTLLKDSFKSGVVTIKNLGGNLVNLPNTSGVIQQLREISLEFNLSIPNLSLSKAKEVIEKARIEQEDMELRKVKTIFELFLAGGDKFPGQELSETASRGLLLLFEFSEKSPIPWFSIACLGVIAAAQIACGGLLIATGFGATVGMSLITEGSADIFTAYRAYSNRQFSWKDYGTQKAVSLTISVISMGLSSLKDAAQGATLVVESVGKEAAEQAGKSLIMEGTKQTLNTTIKVAGDNLRSLAVQQICVGVGEAALREVGNYGMDQLGKFAMSSLRPQIIDKVETDVTNGFFTNSELQRLSKLLYAVDKKMLESKILATLAEMTAGSVWAKYWQSVGLPLVRGVLSNSRHWLANLAAQAVRFTTVLNGIKEIGYAMMTFCSEVLKRLMKIDLSPTKLLQLYAGLSPEDAAEVGDHVEISVTEHSTKFIMTSTLSWGTTDEKASVSAFFHKINKSQDSRFELENISMTLKTVVDSLSDHIIRISESQLIAPVSSYLVGKAVSSVSEWAQENFIVDAKESVEGEPMQNTVAGQIQANAKQFTIAWMQRENFAELLNMLKEGGDSDSNVDISRLPDSVKLMASEILIGGPADANILLALGTKHGLNLRIVGPDYVPTEEDRASGASILVFNKGEVDPLTGQVGVGHYDIMDTKSGGISKVVVPDGSSDCGYEALNQLLGGSTDPNQLRREGAATVINNAEAFERIAGRNEWISSRYPSDTTSNLFIGAGEDLRKSVKVEDGSDKTLNEDEPGPDSVVNKEESKFAEIERKNLVNDVANKIRVDTVEGVIILPGVGTKPSPAIREEVKNQAQSFALLDDKIQPEKFIAGHVYPEKVGRGDGSNGLNIEPMTKSLNSVYSWYFENQLKTLDKLFPGQPLYLEYKPEMEFRNEMLHNMKIKIGIQDQAAPEVKQAFNEIFENVKKNQQPVYRKEGDTFTTTMYHNPRGKADFYEKQGKQYRPAGG